MPAKKPFQLYVCTYVLFFSYLFLFIYLCVCDFFFLGSRFKARLGIDLVLVSGRDCSETGSHYLDRDRTGWEVACKTVKKRRVLFSLLTIVSVVGNAR